MRQGMPQCKADTVGCYIIGSLGASLEGVAGRALPVDSLDSLLLNASQQGLMMGMMSEEADQPF